jgi:hypothetical protein
MTMRNSTKTRKGGARSKGTAARMKKRRPGPVESFIALSDEAKERIWEGYNREIPLSETRPLTAAERKRWEKAKKRMGRPKVGRGAKVISLSVERGLLERADAYAQRTGMSRAQLVARGLENILAAAG